MGDEDRAPTAAEMARMRERVAEAMEAGRHGALHRADLRAGLLRIHGRDRGAGGVAAAHGGGYASHIRSEGDRLVEAVEEAIAIGERAGTWVQIHHLKASGRANWGKMPPPSRPSRRPARAAWTSPRTSTRTPRRAPGSAPSSPAGRTRAAAIRWSPGGPEPARASAPS
jgi:hypothetical protein